MMLGLSSRRQLLFTVLGIGSGLLLGACHSSGPTTVAGFQVAWTAKPPALTIHSKDGRELLNTAGPLLETRTTKATWQEQFGAFLVSEDDTPWNEPASMSLKSSSSQHLVFDVTQAGGHHGTIDVSSPADGVLALTLTGDGENRVRTGFACAASDRFLGFGAQTDALDHHGHKIPIWTSEPGIGKTMSDDPDPNGDWFLVGARHAASYPLPAFLSNHGFAFVADSTRRQVFDLCQADPTRWTVETWDNTITLKVYDGPQPAAALERMTADTGRQPLANNLVLAPWNDAIFGSDNVRKIAGELRAAHIPSGALWTEDFRGGSLSGDNYRLKENWDVDRTLYPDVEQVAKDLHSEGFRWLAYHNTFLTSGSEVLPQAEAQGVVIHQADGTEYDFTNASFASSSMVDLNNPDGVKFVKDWLTKIAGYGFDGWMSDYAEWLPADAKLADGSNAEEVHNTYPLAYDKLNAEVWSSLNRDPDTSVYFVRSGTLRAAPYQPVVWGGDQLTSFDQLDGLPSALMRGLNLGLGGVALYGSDIAGYQNEVLPPTDRELFYRWTTMGALSTVMRTHHGTKATLNWRFDTDAETTQVFAKWAQFHAQLWPYLRSAAQEAHDHGMPIMRVLPLAYPDDSTVWSITDEYLFGPALLVAPVLTQGATSRNVYFPGDKWLPFEAGGSQQGPAMVSQDIPLDEIGLYARAGSIIPMLPERLDTLMPADPPLVTLADVKNDRVLHVFAGANGHWTDLDGTQYTLQSSSNEAVTAVKLNGAALAACTGGTMPCADVDADHRLVTVQGAALANVEFDTASGNSTLAVNGALQVEKVVFRY